MNRTKAFILASGILATMPAGVLAGEEGTEPDSLGPRLESLERDVQELKQETAESSVLGTDSIVHLAGYGAIGFSDVNDGDRAFSTASFNPIFHYQYKDKVLFEAELEVEIGENGETEIGLEYNTIDLVLNDNAVLVVGKFLSPLGYFRQNLHPA